MAKPQNSSIAYNDFNSTELIKNVEDHARDLVSMSARIEMLEKKFGNNEKIADTWCDIIERDTKLQIMLANTFLKLLNENKEVKKSISSIVNSEDRKAFYGFFKKFGGLIAAGVLLFAGAVLKGLADIVIHAIH